MHARFLSPKPNKKLPSLPFQVKGLKEGWGMQEKKLILTSG